MEQLNAPFLPAPEKLLEQYAAFVWKTAAAYLDQPEDIKEIVNDTFFEFYYHADRYDPQKGSYGAFLGAIARHKAADRRRKLASEKSEAAGCDPSEGIPDAERSGEDLAASIAQRADLEAALGALNPEEFDLIRMKYYDGMTLKEIADSLHLPYETVKKRHQRSLGKLKRMLLLGLILALLAALAACAYAILRYFGIVPGYGVSTDPASDFYVMEAPVHGENEEVGVTLEKAFLNNGQLDVIVHMQRKEGFQSTSTASWDSILSSDLLLMADGESISPSVTASLPVESGTGVTAEARVQYRFFLSEEANPEELSLCLSQLELPIRLTAAGQLSLEEFSYELTEFGGIAADPYWEEDHLMVDLYLLNTGDYQIIVDPDLTTITLTAEDGTTLVGTEDENAIFRRTVICTMDFGEAAAGTYTLSIPRVLLGTQLPEDFQISLADVISDPSKAGGPLPGGTLTVGEPVSRHPNPEFPSIPGSTGKKRLYLPLAVTPSREDFALNSLFLQLNPADDPHAAIPAGESGVVTLLQEDGTYGYWGLQLAVPEDTEFEEYVLAGASGEERLLHYFWNHEFLLSFTVEE